VKASNPHDETFVINFSDQAYLDQDFTSDIGALQNGLAPLSQSGGTALYDTVITAADKMERSATRPRKVLIVITDGDDNSSKLTLMTRSTTSRICKVRSSIPSAAVWRR